MSQTTLSSALYIAVYDVLKDHFLTEKDRLTLLLPLKADLPKSFDQIDFDDASGAFTVHLIDVLQQYPNEFDVVLEAASKWVGVDKAAQIHALRDKVKNHYATVRPQVIDNITQTVTDSAGNVISTSQQILHTLDQLAAAAPKRTSQRNRRLVTRLLWQFGIFAVVVGISALTNQMADLFVRSLGISGILAALTSSALQYFVRVDELKADENAVTVALNGLARGIGWLSAALIGGLFGGLLFTTVGVGWGLAACAYGLPLTYAIWALLPPQGVDYLIHSRDSADRRIQEHTELHELRDRVRRYWLEGILRRGLEEQVGEMNINLEQNALIYDEAAGAFKVEEAGEGDIPRTSMSIYRLYRHFAYRFFILGEPGSGKTIMLLRLAADMLADKGRPYLPLVLNLSSYRGGDLAEWIVKEGAATYNVATRTLQDWHDRRLFALLLDGLDEIPDDAPDHYRAQCARAINAYIAAQDANRDLNRASVVVCSRVAEHKLMLDYNPDAQLHALTNRVVLKPLVDTQIKQIITPTRYRALHAALQHDPILRGEEVAGVPFLLNAMVYAYGNKTDENELALPDGESGIVARRNHLIHAYLLRRFNDPNSLPDRPEDLLRWLRWIAARTLATGTIFRVGALDSRWLDDRDKRRSVTYRVILWGLFGILVALPLSLLAGYSLWQGIAALGSLAVWGTLYGWIQFAGWAVIIVLISLALFAVVWLWGEVLAPALERLWATILTPYWGPRVAWSLAQGSERLPANLLRFNTSMIERQVMRPLGGGYAFRHRYLEQHLVQGSKQAEAQVAVLIERLRQPEQSQAVFAGLLALLGTQQAVSNHLFEALTNDALRNGAEKALTHMGTFAIAPLVDGLIDITHAPEVRAAMGRALAELGDPRKGVGVANGLPDMLWLPVESGKLTIANKEFTVHPFFISKYLVTYMQFQTFLEAADGFNNDRWWDGMPDQYKRQAMRDQNNRQPNAPRARVSWYQAVAFGRWMTHRFDGLTLPYEPSRTVLRVGDNAEIRLPLEWEWQWAAQGGSEQRQYPWGDWQEGYANTREAGLGLTSAVGMYPHGTAVCGALDMAGNVWEWCQNDGNDPNTIDKYIIDNSKVVRGGSFYGGQNFAACAFRGSDGPYDMYGDDGLRLVVCPLIASLSSGTLRGGT
jgi:hypothetical protein